MDVSTLEHLILRKLRRGGQLSRRDLADQLDIARSTAGRRVESLIERELLFESGVESRSTVGRPRRFLEFHRDFGGFMGIDFDARRAHGVVIDFAHNLVARKSIKLPPGPTAKNVLRTIRQLKRKLEDKAGDLPILMRGVGVPGRVDRENLIGHEYPFIKGWKDIDLATELECDANTIRIENNTRTGALGEFWFGPNAGASDLLYLNIRTGFSAAIIANGELIAGGHEMAGEIRSWPAWNPSTGKVHPHGLEATATIRAITEATGSNDNEAWGLFCEACQKKQSKALAKLKAIAALHGGAAANALKLTDPQVVIIAGWFTQLGKLYLNYLTAATREALAGHWFTDPVLQLSTLGEYSGALGAAALASDSFVPEQP